MAKRSDAYRALDELGTEPAVYYKTEHKTHDKA
jgi:hypothetical protein